jgi:hypothetical protein
MAADVDVSICARASDGCATPLSMSRAMTDSEVDALGKAWLAARGRVIGLRYQFQQEAHYLITKGIRDGVLDDLRYGTTSCYYSSDGCTNKAEVYEHRDYAKPLEVDPACRSCNGRLGRATISDPVYIKRVRECLSAAEEYYAGRQVNKRTCLRRAGIAPAQTRIALYALSTPPMFECLCG